MKNAIAIFLTLVLLISVGCFLIFKMYKSIESFPEYAKHDVVYAQNTILLKAVEQAIKNSQTTFSLAANLEKIDKPKELLYMALQKIDDQKTKNSFDKNDQVLEIFKKPDSHPTTTFLINGTGVGYIGDKEIIIIEYPVNQFGIEKCTIYLERVTS